MSAMEAAEQVARARAAQATWAATKPFERARVLSSLRKRIALERESLVEAIVADTGKPALDALAGDVLVALEQMRFYEHHATSLLAPRRIGRSSLFFAGCKFREYFEPRGVALVFGPANYPLQLCLVPAVTALYAGNAVVLKVSERTPKTAGAIQTLLQACSLPDDLLQVTCVGPQDAEALVEAGPDVVFFTGSGANGRAVAARAAVKGIPAVLELGGSDAALVFADCNVERTLDGILYGAFSNAGQVCVGVKRLFVESSLHDRFVKELVRRAAALRIGSGHNGDLGRLPTESARQLFEAQVADALERGAKLETPSPFQDGPVILTDVPRRARLLREECFGPALCVQSFVTEEEAIALANESQFGLGASVWTRDLSRGRRVAKALNTGSCTVNDVIRSVANPQAAFGGNRASGYGRYHGAHGLYAFSQIKTVMENRSERREINWFPLTHKHYDGLSKLIELRHRPSGALSALRKVLHLAVAVAMVTLVPAMKAQVAHLILQVHLPGGAHGRIAYLVFASAEGFPQDTTKAVIHGFTGPVGKEREERIDVGALPAGRYAVSLYLDENSNGRLDTGLLGIPLEPVGVSNNPPRRRGSPRFKNSAFTMGPTTQTLAVNLVRP